MNLFQWLLNFVYTGIALGGLCARSDNNLFIGSFSPGEEGAALQEKRRIESFDLVCNTALNLGAVMSNAVLTKTVGEYNQSLINHFQQAQEHNTAALKLVEPANKQGA